MPSREKGSQRTTDRKQKETSRNAHMAGGMCCKGRAKAVPFTSVLRAKLPARSSWKKAQHSQKAFGPRAWDKLRVGRTESRSAETTASGVDRSSGQRARVFQKVCCWVYQQHSLRHHSRSASSFRKQQSTEVRSVTIKRHSTLRCLEIGRVSVDLFLVLPGSKRQQQHACNQRHLPRRSVQRHVQHSLSLAMSATDTPNAFQKIIEVRPQSLSRRAHVPYIAVSVRVRAQN